MDMIVLSCNYSEVGPVTRGVEPVEELSDSSRPQTGRHVLGERAHQLPMDNLA